MARRHGAAKAPRFGIGEWYGKSFVNLSSKERRRFAVAAQKPTTVNAPRCPFIGSTCPKKGGVCSLRLYSLIDPETNEAEVVTGDEGDLRITCPHRFKQDNAIYAEIGSQMVGDSNPLVVSEIRFLQRVSAGEDASEDAEDVGNIDVVLVNSDASFLRWCALEIQAVYFSGRSMSSMFKQIEEYRGSGIPFPNEVRRPDYRSSGPKRLMPQLQIKVPTLRRWGKKMAVVVDAAWFRNNVIDVAVVNDLSNCDIAWFLIGFDESTDPATLIVNGPEMQTLERAVEGLTGGYPVTLSAFEAKITDKLESQ